jgi:hypothetical protein
MAPAMRNEAALPISIERQRSDCTPDCRLVDQLFQFDLGVPIVIAAAMLDYWTFAG